MKRLEKYIDGTFQAYNIQPGLKYFLFKPIRFFVIFLILISFYSPYFAYSQDSIGINYIASFGNFENASSITMDSEKNIYIIDRAANMMYKYSPDFKLIYSFGGFGWSEQSFDNPVDMCISFGWNIFVADHNNHRIQRFDRNMNYVSTISGRRDQDEVRNFGFPLGVCVSGNGELYLIDSENTRIVKLNAFGEFDKSFGGLNSGFGKLDNPAKIRINADNYLYILDNNLIKIYDKFGNFLQSISIPDGESKNSFFINNNLLYLLSKRNLDVMKITGGDVFPVSLDGIIFKEDVIFNDILINEENMYLLSSNKIYLFNITKY